MKENIEFRQKITQLSEKNQPFKDEDLDSDYYMRTLGAITSKDEPIWQKIKKID